MQFLERRKEKKESLINFFNDLFLYLLHEYSSMKKKKKQYSQREDFFFDIESLRHVAVLKISLIKFHFLLSFASFFLSSVFLFEYDT